MLQEGGAGTELHDEAGQVVLVKVVTRHQTLILHWHQHGMDDLVLLCEAQVACGIKLGHEYNGAT